MVGGDQGCESQCDSRSKPQLRKSNPKAQRKAKDVEGMQCNGLVEEGSKLGNEAILQDYLQLGVCVENLHEDWTRNDPHLSQVAAWVSGT